MAEGFHRNELTDVEVTFTDGEVKTYLITAGLGIARHLAEHAGETGVLTLMNADATYGIPMSQIKEYTLKPHVETKDA